MKFLLILGICCLSSSVFANNNDQVLMIITAQQGEARCITEIVTVGGDNCLQGNGSRGDCDGEANCACIKPDKHIEWQSDVPQPFTVYFYDGSPFKENCKLTASNDGKLKCRIKVEAGGDYDYGVQVSGCADFDPRIVVKQ